MWVLFLIPFAVVSGSDTTTEDCSSHSFEGCRSDDMPEGFPASVEELDRACNGLIEYYRCVIPVEEECHSDPFFLNFMQGHLEVANELCDKDGPLYEALVNNLECAHKFFESRVNDQCFKPPRNEELERYIESLMEENEEHSYNEDELFQINCPSTLRTVACITVKMEEKCGEDAMEAFMKVSGKVIDSGMSPECSEEMSDYLPTIVSMYKAGQEREDDID